MKSYTIAQLRYANWLSYNMRNDRLRSFFKKDDWYCASLIEEHGLFTFMHAWGENHRTEIEAIIDYTITKNG